MYVLVIFELSPGLPRGEHCIQGDVKSWMKSSTKKVEINTQIVQNEKYLDEAYPSISALIFLTCRIHVLMFQFFIVLVLVNAKYI